MLAAGRAGPVYSRGSGERPYPGRVFPGRRTEKRSPSRRAAEATRAPWCPAARSRPTPRMDLPIESWLLLLNLAATGMMVGVIWFVQLVHYPLFARAGIDGFGWYAAAHARWAAWAVAPAMLVEAVTGLLLLRWPPPGVPWYAPWAGVGLIVLLWASTFMVQVPCNAALARGWNPAIHRRLLATNWIRTLLWTARGVLLLWMLAFLL